MKHWLAAALSLIAFGAASAAEVAGVKLSDTATVAGQELRLNGAGLRQRAFFKDLDRRRSRGRRAEESAARRRVRREGDEVMK